MYLTEDEDDDWFVVEKPIKIVVLYVTYTMFVKVGWRQDGVWQSL